MVSRRPPSFKIAPRAVPHDRHGIEIVHAGTAEGAVGGRESGRLDDVGLDSEARAQPQYGSRVLRDIGLIKGDAHGRNRGGPVPARPGCACRQAYTCTLPARVPIKRRRYASPLTFPRPDATGLSAAPAARTPREGARFAARVG